MSTDIRDLSKELVPIIKPTVLSQGDLIGIVSPSADTVANKPRRFERGVDALEKLGFKVKVGKFARASGNYTAGSAAERVSDLHEMFQDTNVRAIFASIGGYNSNQLLELLDYELFHDNPKIMMGYSDTTAVLLAISKMSNLVTFTGPSLLPQFGEFEGLHPYSQHSLASTLMSVKSIGQIDPSYSVLIEQLEWDVEDNRPRDQLKHSGPRAVRNGFADGKIVAGNLATMVAMAGTPYFPDLRGALFCVDISETESLERVDRYLTQLRLMGAFNLISALMLGRVHPNVVKSPSNLDEILERATSGYTFPIAVDFDFGHTDPIFILPNGVPASLSVEQELVFSINDAAVVSAET